jgi:hypothetical protein
VTEKGGVTKESLVAPSLFSTHPLTNPLIGPTFAVPNQGNRTKSNAKAAGNQSIKCKGLRINDKIYFQIYLTNSNQSITFALPNNGNTLKNKVNYLSISELRVKRRKTS